MTDKVYLVNDNKQLIELGEIQTGFNMSLVIDGTKDSMKIQVNSFSGEEALPYTILYHENTNTWWCVQSDKVTRYLNESLYDLEDNETPTYYYTHDIEICGAREILNARDLTDCGLNQNTYTIRTATKKLFRLSNFEYSVTLNSGNVLNLDKKMDYVKTYENYTLLSALRDLYDGYNCEIKLVFHKVGSTISFATLMIYSKTGDKGTWLEESVFNGVDEIKSIDKNSYGTSVMSNAENVISTKTKTFPTTGGIRLSSDEFNIEWSNAIVRLPSNAYKVNWLRMFFEISVNVRYYPTANNPVDVSVTFNPLNDDDLAKFRTRVFALIDLCYYSAEVKQAIKDDFDSQLDSIYECAREMGRVTFYSGNQIDANTGEVVQGENVPYIPSIHVYRESLGVKKVALFDNETGQSLEHKTLGIFYTRNSDKITNFHFLEIGSGINVPTINVQQTDRQNGSLTLYESSNASVVHQIKVSVDSTTDFQVNIHRVSFQANYTPMSNIKIKYDNIGTKRDMQLYNQNGKLTDSVALSKLMLSYSKEIQSDSITKYGSYYSFDSVPKVGQVVGINNIPYVINNVSLDMLPNESGYFIMGEFTLSKQIALKSTMINPNTNIRDYGIPQNYNVKRKQLYRDFYELNLFNDSSSDTPYLGLNKIMNVSCTYKPYQEHIAVIKLTYDNAYGESGNESDTWYYQLETTTFMFKKAIYEVVDFKDNNIIGYGSQNVWCGWVISRIFSDHTDSVNTPISYVDKNGQFKGIEIAFCTNEILSMIYDTYKTYAGINNTRDLMNYSVFIPSEIYEGDGEHYSGASNPLLHDFMINHNSEDNYYEKDATEVPVFEYSCQIDDSENVIIGDNILDTFEEDIGYIYNYVLVDKNTIDNNNFETITPNATTYSGGVYTSIGVVQMRYTNDNKLGMTLHALATFNFDTNTFTYSSPYNITQPNTFKDKDLVIIKKRVVGVNTYVNDLMFVIKNIEDYRDTAIDNNELLLNINYFKLT